MRSVFLLLCLTACASLRERIKASGFISYKEAKCAEFNLRDLDMHEAVESRCGPDCESILETLYSVGRRESEDEMFLTTLEGDATLMLDFKRNLYKRVEFAGDEMKTETGSCQFFSSSSR